MITVKFYHYKHRYAITTSGHANYAPYGQDIVCSAISALVQSYGNYIQDKEQYKSWKVLEVKLDEGDTNVEVIDTMDNVKDLFYMISEGIEDIKKAYPGYISLEYNPDINK